MKPSRAPVVEVFLVFLRLGCTSFGGPVAHLGYFQRELVERRAWCSQAALAELIALAQSLPGPASSQVGFALGILRAGWLGGLAAWAGFTLPSAVLMLAFARGHALFAGGAGTRLLHGLQIVAVAVVAQAVLTMRQTLAPDRARTALAIVAAAAALFVPGQPSALLVVAGGAISGLLLLRDAPAAQSAPHAAVEIALTKRAGAGAAALGLGPLLLLPLLSRRWPHRGLAVFSAFYRSGALVFGGGHVVLPMLERTVVAPGWVGQQTFLAGYGAAQALPGPLFSFAAYLGASIQPARHPIADGLLALAGIFAPGLLAMAAVLPFWSGLRRDWRVQAALRGVNAGVVGLLIAALFRPLWSSTIQTPGDFWLALAGFALLALWKAPSWIVVAGVVCASILRARL